MAKEKKLSTESYKGVRDFYPEDMFVQNYIFDTACRIAERFGYLPYGASVLEESGLYEAKTGEEIVKEQTYTFEDRGGRKVTLRPEMTPTIARMIAAKKRDLVFPLRWYTVANLFRYERPQRGRLREHFQLNCDLFGIAGEEADVEIIFLASEILKSYGATSDMFTIKLGNPTVLLQEFTKRNIPEEHHKTILMLRDRKGKISEDERMRKLKELGGDFDITSDTTVMKVQDALKERGVTNTIFDQNIVRGFDYYTGVVFEIFDTSEDNTRSLFGGGRYDNLMEIFGAEKVPAVGFGMGDVTMRDFLETHKLLPTYKTPTHLSLCVLEESALPFATHLADDLRKTNVNVALNMSFKKAGEQIKAAAKMSIPFALCIGQNEIQNKTFSVKNLATGNETVCQNTEDIVKVVHS